jgi:hypothetical protein
MKENPCLESRRVRTHPCTVIAVPVGTSPLRASRTEKIDIVSVSRARQGTSALSRAGRVFFPLATTALFSGSYVAGEYTTRDLDPLIATFLRYLVALLFLLVLLPGNRPGTLKLSFPASPASSAITSSSS